MITSLFGVVFLITLISISMSVAVKPALAGEIARRLGVSILLFVAGTVMHPDTQQSLLLGGVRLLLCLALWLAAPVYIVAPALIHAVSTRVATVAMALVLAGVLLRLLWSTPAVAVVLIVAGGSFLIRLALRRQ